MPKDLLPDDSFADIAVALFEETRQYAESNERLTVLAERLQIAGLSQVTRDRIVNDAMIQAQRIVSAYKIMRALSEHEAKIRVLLSQDRLKELAAFEEARREAVA